MKPKRLLSIITSCLVLAGCAGFQRSCSADLAEDFGADWIIVQYNYNGGVVACWQLDGRSVANEREGSDGIYWASGFGHLVHISGWYNRVQVNNSDYAGAARALQIDLARCLKG